MSRQKKISLFFWGILLLVALILMPLWFFRLRYIEYTDDAYVHGNQVYITPLHDGFVTSIHTDDSFFVKKGQLLVTLDKTDAEIAFSQAKENLAQVVRQVCEIYHQVFAYRSEIDLKKVEFIRNAQDYLHRYKVFKEQGVSLEDYEHAIAALRSQYASLEVSEALYHKTLALIQNASLNHHPLIVAAADQLRDAWVRLYRCDIYAPVDGLVAQRTIQVGMWIPEGQLMMSVIPLDQIWINANYKETQIKNMRLGQKVDITVDLWGDDHLFHGTIVGLPGGAGNAFSLLPPQNLSGNWIKIVQRLPIRVALDPEEIARWPLRLGLSCKAIVDVRDPQGILVPKTSAGSPRYETSVFDKEERGDIECIRAVLRENIDPMLANYADQKIDLPALEISLPALVKEAYQLDQNLQSEIISYE